MSSVWSLRRSTTDGKLAGVCSGAARYADVDPLLVRVAAVLLALSGGIGLVVYGAAWLLIPDENGRAPADQHLPSVRHWKRSSLIVAVVVACIVMASLFSAVAPFSVTSAFVLALIWYFGYYKNRPSRPRPDESPAGRTVPPGVAAPPPPPPFRTFTGPPTPFTEAAAAWQRRITEVQRQSAPAPAAAAQHPWPTMPVAGAAPTAGVSEPTPDPRAEWDRQQFLAAPDPVGLYTEPAPVPVVRIDPRRTVAARRLRLSWLLATGIVIAGLAIADAAGAAISASLYLASALLVTGITLVLGAFLGRARGILAVAVLLALAIGANSVATPFREVGSWSESTKAYTSLAELPATQTIDGGSLSVDLTDIDITQDQTYAVSVGTGNLEIARPADGNVRIEYTVDRGAVDLPGDSSRAGQDLTAVVEPAGGLDPGEPVLTIRADVGLGVLQVTR